MTSSSTLAALGLLGCVLCVAQTAFPSLQWNFLIERQLSEPYKVASGLALAAYLVVQGFLSLSRVMEGWMDLRVLFLRWHVRLGLAALPLLWLHASRWGYASQAVLWWAFLGNVAAGFCSPSLWRIGSSAYVFWWMVVHVAASLFVYGLTGYHAYVAFAYS